MIAEYKLITHNNNGEISRDYEGFVVEGDLALEKFHPSHKQAKELEEGHDQLIKNHPKIKLLTTIVKE